MFADGRAKETVLVELRKRGVPSDELDAVWVLVVEDGVILVSSRRRRLVFLGIVWLALGVVLLGGLLWAMWFHGSFPWILLTGTIPACYGLYLLCLPPTKEPDFESPRIFGKNL